MSLAGLKDLMQKVNWIPLQFRDHDIISGIDIDLQEYGELLMKNKRGSIVAIEPETGEVLTLVSSPNYDPGLACGKDQIGEFFHALS